MKEKSKSTALLLHDIRSVHNVGSIFRTAECLGISKIFLSGTTPAPIDRFERKRKDFAKVSLGAEDLIKWKQVADVEKFLAYFQKQGYIIALEQDARAVDYKEINIPTDKEILVLVGNEVSGIPKSHLDFANVIAQIPQVGKKESLNVSIATGIALFRWFDK